MKSLHFISITLLCLSSTIGQSASDATYKLVLPNHNGQLRWSAEGFKLVQSSAKPDGQETGLRGIDQSGRLTFLGFLFLVRDGVPLTSEKCRDGALDVQKKSGAGMKILGTSEIARSGQPSVSLVTYQGQTRNGIQYAVRAFVASGDECGDLEFYSSKPISSDDADLKSIFSTYELNTAYTPRFGDVVWYAQILYGQQSFKAAAPIFEKALAMVPEDGAPYPSAKIARRVVTDNAGMAYGIAGDIQKARVIFENAIAEDPDYPMYHYNLACADAQERKLPEAQHHLEEAFRRKANVIPGETMPDPTKDDSFLPYQSDKQFWAFLTGLRVPDAADAPDPTKPDFSGSYTLTGTKRSAAMNKASQTVLQVVQRRDEIAVTKTIEGKPLTNRFKLDGNEAPYVTEGGVMGTCAAHFKGKALVLEVQVTSHPTPNGPSVQMHTREQWTLSSDRKTLNSHTDVDFPNSGLGGFQVIEPWSETYARN